MTTPHYSDNIKHWGLDRSITFLNHGSFGATPLAVLQKQNEYRSMMESEPVRFMTRQLEPMLWEAKESLAKFHLMVALLIFNAKVLNLHSKKMMAWRIVFQFIHLI